MKRARRSPRAAALPRRCSPAAAPAARQRRLDEQADGSRSTDRARAAGGRRDRRARASTPPRSTARPRPAWSRSARSSARQRRRRGLRLRPQRRRRDRHQRPRRHRRIERRAASRRSRSSSSSPTATWSRPRSSASTPSPTSPCCGSSPTASTCTRWSSATTRPAGRPAGGGDRQPLRRAAVALGRGRLRHRPLGRIADRVPDRGRDPDRRLDQPRQLGRAAARRRRPGDRDQPADRDQLRRQRRRRLRGPDLGDQALDRPAREDGEAEYAYIGVSSQSLYPQLADKLGLDTDFGGLLAEVVPGGPADKAGLEGGDEKLASRPANTGPAAT